MKKVERKFILYKPAKSAMQSGLLNTKKWCLKSKDVSQTFINSKYCWTGTSNSEKQIKLFFNSKDAAIKFANENNYIFEIIEPKSRKYLKKSYAANFVRKS
tara:strand:+ start:375 stop:677 length:303 start_codon:yes stop_codon:yes gene_type:complete